MNDGHKWACASNEWRQTVREQIIPWVVGGLDLGDDVIELGPGYGATTDVFQELLPRLTAVEIDSALAIDLIKRFDGTNVRVVEGDATALTFDDDCFTGALCFSMLHHVPTLELQDQLFAEARRVLRPGAVFAATDSLDDPGLRDFHKDDTFVPVDPDTLTDRLERAGFVDIAVDRNPYAWKVAARST
ncbi:MAG TPA: class I SAM-dependent methyltransferase [Acidimicrobiales bacterium]|nr:class I SAM-dependent methyltransferase [Acidimicrobiales bacterium]